ncbi:MAG: flavodoxin [Eisenbergiella sp.]
MIPAASIGSMTIPLCEPWVGFRTVNDWDSYDTVFIGYPIWWGIAAWPVDSFIAANDFSGKTVIPFCTSVSSGLGTERSAFGGGGRSWRLDGRPQVLQRSIGI